MAPVVILMINKMINEIFKEPEKGGSLQGGVLSPVLMLYYLPAIND